MFELIFDFKSKKFSNCHLAADGYLIYDDSFNKPKTFKFPIELYNGNDTKDFFRFQSREKNQVVFIFLPNDFFLEKQINPTNEESLTSLEIEYDSNFEILNKWSV